MALWPFPPQPPAHLLDVRPTWAAVLLLALLILPVSGQGCDHGEAEVCLGGRPRTPIGCCPVAEGDDCGSEVGVECDSGLGYQCLDSQGNVTTRRGRCEGPYNVHVTATSTDSVSLEWTDFKPHDYLYEYVLLYHQSPYTDDLSTWTLWDIGTQPHYTVRKLTAGTAYFMRLAVWADARAEVLGNMSETIWVQTDPVSYCRHGQNQYEVGEVVENCEDRCTCTATGHLDCVPVCRESELPDVPEGCHLYFPEECSCQASIYCPSEEAPCEFEGEEYRDGIEVELGCRSCRCRQGTMSCDYPEECHVPEATAECPTLVTVPQPNGTCCPNWRCNQDASTPPSTEGCQYKGTSYSDGAAWTDTIDCTSCTCHAGHVTCNFTCEEPVVPEGCVNPVTRTADYGCCAVIVCDSESLEGEAECRHNGTDYRPGETFTDGCSLCVCDHGNNITCSSTSCPSIDLPVPSILCPFPHVRQDGCCDTVFCEYENMDAQTLFSRLMAISFGPDSLTISFDVDHSSGGSTGTHNRYEVMMSDQARTEGGASSSWLSRTFWPRTLTVDDNASTPLDLLHGDEAIRVGDRVYITVAGLNPNTTYYVRVQPVVKRDMKVDVDNASSSALVGFFAARTMEQGTSCLVRDKSFPNGATISTSCEEVCSCVNGDVICQSACPEEQVVMAPSSSCPRPQLVASTDSCCRRWQCFPEEGGCVHGSTLMKNGEQVYEGVCDRKCRCTNGEVKCTPVCLPVSPAPRPSCVLTNVSGTCCPMWMCPQETRPPLSISLAAQIGFHGYCSDDDSYQTSLKRMFESRLEGHLSCADRESPFFVQCWIDDVSVTCPSDDAYRKRRQTVETEVVVVILANITEAYTESKIQTSLNVTGTTLAAMFSTTDIRLQLDSGKNLTSSGSFQVFGVSYVCESGFIAAVNTCVPQYLSPPSVPLRRHNMSMAVVNVTHDSVFLTWPPLPSSPSTGVTGLVIEFHPTTATDWTRTMTLSPDTTRWMVTSLLASRQYEARLVAVTGGPTPGRSRVSLSVVQFTTAAHEVLNGTLTFDPFRVSLGVTSVTVTWTPLSTSAMAAITTLQIACRRSQDADNFTYHDLDPRVSHMTLEGLDPKTAYVSKFLVSLVNGTTITTAPLHFVTMSEESSSMPVVPLLATCAVLLVLSILLPLAFFVWRRIRKKSTVPTAFENKTYGVNIDSLCTTRAKNESARPQDAEDGSVAAPSTAADDCGTQA